MALEFKIVTGSPLPIYRQVVDQVRAAVATGALAVGDQLPSVRALGEQLVINPNTVARAYAELTQEGVLVAQAGKGLFVAERRQRLSPEERHRRLEAATETFVKEVLFLDFEPEEILQHLQEKLLELQGDSILTNRSRHE